VADVEYRLRPIGRVDASEKRTILRIDDPYRPALEGLADFGHAIVLFWCHRTDSDEVRHLLTCERPYTKGPDRLGVFATRSPARPNPIGLTPVSIVHLDAMEGAIYVPYLDAEDSTPILDLKPYQPSLDRIRDVRMPDWCAHWPPWQEESATFDWDAEFAF